MYEMDTSVCLLVVVSSFFILIEREAALHLRSQDLLVNKYHVCHQSEFKINNKRALILISVG